MSDNTWADNTRHEIEYWENAVRDMAAVVGEKRRKPVVKGYGWLRTTIQPAPTPNEPIRVLDVGSGPMSTLGVQPPDSTDETIATDALGDTYNRLLDQYGFTDFPRIRSVPGEGLSGVFGKDAFHLVNCANALDHFADPARAFLEMMIVCKPGGIVWIVAKENEGEDQEYNGLHQWNLIADDDGLWLWNKTNRMNLTKMSPDVGQYSWKYHAKRPMNSEFAVEIRKRF
jgi:ubiquinone/menaquinone biosynthesis C-methylase UbiE